MQKIMESNAMKHPTIFCLLICIFIITGTAYPGTTGKIAGKIIDAATREPLISVSIMINGTSLGAASDLDGNYIILNVPPGVYSVVVSIIGYKQVQFDNVRVNIDLTTTLDAELQESAVELETVFVTAEKPLVQKDITSSLTSIGSKEIELLPAQSVTGLLELQAGVINYGGIHIRGGRSGEVAYWVDGVATTDAFYGGQGIRVENSAIEELQVVSGTFNAEYGQAMSGIVNIITKEGKSKYSGQISAYIGDYFSTSDIYNVSNRVEVTEAADGSLQEYAEYENPLKKLNPSYNTELSLSGPIPFSSDKLTFFTNIRYFSDEGYYYGKNWFTPQGLRGDSSLVPLNPYDQLSIQGKLTWSPFSNVKISYNGFWNEWNRERINWRDYKYSPYSIPKQFGNSNTHILSWNQVLSPETFFEIRLNKFYSESSQYLYEDPTLTPHWMVTVTDDSGGVSVLDLATEEGRAQLSEAQLNQWSYAYFIDPANAEGYVHPDSQVAPAQYSFRRGGTDLNHNFRSTSYWVGKFDMTSQISKEHLLKFGGEVRLYELKLDNFLLQQKIDERGNTIQPFAPAIPDISTIYHHKYTREPREISVYLQDKMEFDDLIVNMGLRFDYFDANSVMPVDPTDPNIYDPFRPENKYRDWQAPPEGLSSAERQDYEKQFTEYTPEERRAFMHKKVESKMQLSPRLGIAYPISDKGVVHFSYGHFFQIPEFRYLYDVPDFKLGSGNNNILGNANLKAQKTVQYEIGLSQQLGEQIGIDLTVFYRDIRNWVGTSPVQKTFRPSVSYVTYENKDYSNVRGFNIKLERRLTETWGARVDYSFQVAEGTYSNPTDAFNALRNNQEPRLNLIPLNWDQRHTLHAQLLTRIYGWTLTFIAKFNTGTPYSPTFAVSEAVGSSSYTGLTENSARKPQIHSYDLYLTKTFNVYNLDLTLFLYAYNIFDQRGATGVYSDTGDPSYTTNPRLGSIAPVIERIGTARDLYTRTDFYIAPRQMQVGLSLGF
jgi:outer membrane receptor protein involved in Fe transport